MKQVKLFNPVESRKSNLRNVVFFANITQVAVAFTSGISVMLWAYDSAMKYVGTWAYGSTIAIIAAIITGIFAGLITDIGFGRMLQEVLFRVFCANHPNLRQWQETGYFSAYRKAELFMDIAILAGLFAIDVACMFVATDQVTERVADGKTTEVNQLRAQLESEQAARIQDLKASKSEKQSEIKRIQQDAMRQNQALAELASNGNGWAQGKLNKISQAKTRNADKSLQTIEQEYAAALSSGSTYINERIKEAEMRNADVTQKNAAKQHAAEVIYLLFTIGLKLLTIMLRVKMVVAFVAYSRDFVPDLTGDGIIDYQDLQQFTGENHKAQRSAPHNPHEADFFGATRRT